ncbi:hypothetical protein WY02_03425 [Pseudonocardia sp. AL041005-10]|nr:hypothetical protein [Pseudonocardia sp. AL041005-10]ALE77655.1 hypothetical protein WY02_03425 [Pseudonocardia sp. AL041005-10]
MVNLSYGTNPGCVARQSMGGSPGQCGGREAAAVPHRFKYPRPHAARLYVCEYHAREAAGAEPLTDEDRATIARRYARRDEQLRPYRERMERAES